MTLIPCWALLSSFDVGRMDYYFGAAMLLMPFCVFLLWKSSRKKHFVWLHNILKVLIVVGVFSILMIDMDLLINRFL
jgi:4-hydroxybenzoate polyprenyltransferase